MLPKVSQTEPPAPGQQKSLQKQHAEVLPFPRKEKTLDPEKWLPCQLTALRSDYAEERHSPS